MRGVDRRCAVSLLIVGPLFAQKSSTRFRIITFGDSLTAPRNGVTTYSDVLRDRLPAFGAAADVINAGVPGNTSEMARARFEKDVISQKPDLVIIQLGTNDSAIDVWKNPPATQARVSIERFQENMEFFVQTLRTSEVEVILMTPLRMAWTDKLRSLYGKPPYRTDNDNGFNFNRVRYAAVVRRIAGQRNGPLVDAEALVPTTALLDGLHPGSEGHRLVAEALLQPVAALLRKLP
jgi:lysophospholipase L1-like esterase